MKYAVIKTQATGLFDYKRPGDAEGQPRLTELAIVTLDDMLAVESEFQAYVRPDGWEVPPEVVAVNKLTTAFLAERGRPVDVVIGQYAAAVLAGHVIVAHNIAHETKMLRAELRRLGQDDLHPRTGTICTMRGLTDVCRIPPPSGRGGYKFPKLSEALVHFGRSPAGEPDALADARRVAELLRCMRDSGCSLDPKFPAAAAA